MSEIYALHDSIGYRMTLLSRINERRFDGLLAATGLTRVTWCVLLAVGQQYLQNPSEIADWVGIDRTATSRALRRLEADKMIARASAASDKRQTVVSVTDKGRDILQSANTAASENAQHFNDKLSWYEQETLAAILVKLMQDETRDVPGF
ncbi:MAG: winged helix DNA-binding protein [Proteobacteria bacterium]|nr:winged helix DNA-binding protein [Pseudomonadota bacterium]MDA1284959.1 winged helix DNA-binding protein [Pseudomonadota bacterium]